MNQQQNWEQFSKTAEFSDFNNENFEILIGGFSLAMNGIDSKIFKENGFRRILLEKDLQGINRVVVYSINIWILKQY